MHELSNLKKKTMRIRGKQHKTSWDAQTELKENKKIHDMWSCKEHLNENKTGEVIGEV